MNRHTRFLRNGRRQGAEPGLQPEYVPETEAEQARRRTREWLRSRTDEDAIDFPDEIQDSI